MHVSDRENRFCSLANSELALNNDSIDLRAVLVGVMLKMIDPLLLDSKVWSNKKEVTICRHNCSILHAYSVDSQDADLKS